MSDKKSIYWAALPKEELGDELADRIREYYELLSTCGLIELWRTSHAHNYGLDPQGQGHETSSIVEFGDNGEKLGVRSNQVRSLLSYILTSATADRPALQPKAINSTAKAMAQVGTARRVLEYYMKHKGMERQLKSCALRALLYGKGYLWQTWDPSLGKMVAQPPPAPVPGQPPPDPTQPPPEPVMAREGDLIYQACSPMEVVCDLDRNAGDHDWFTVRQSRNRYDVSAVYASDATDDGASSPANDLRDQILDLQTDVLESAMVSRIGFGLHRRKHEQASDVYIYHFLHKRTPSVPEGRYAIMAGDGLILFDGPLPFDEVPIDEMVPEEFLEAGSVGYASAWDLIGLQDAYDALLSTCMTNFDAFGHSDMLIPSGVELEVEEVREGLNAIRYPAGPDNRPSMLEKFSIRGEVFTLKEWLKSDMELATGVNSVARGEPEASLKSGAALALVQAQAIHFQSGFVGSYVQLIETSATKTVGILKQYAKTTRIAAIAGSNDPDGLKAFSSHDLDQIDRIEVEQGNPIFRTLAGKFDMANNLLERGLIKDPAQYYQVLETGRLEPVSDPLRKCALMVAEENEALMLSPQVAPKQAQPPMPGMPPKPPVNYVPTVPALMSDDPVAHIKGHMGVLDSQENRANPTIVASVTAHVLDHLDVWRNAPQDFLQLMGYPLPPPLPGDPAAMHAQAQQGQDQAKGKGAPPGKTQDQGKKPPAGDGTQPGQDAPDQGSGMPSLPKPAQDPLADMR